MPPVPAHLTQMFLALTAAVAALFVSAQSRLAGETPAERRRGSFAGMLVVGAWLAVPGVLASRGALSDFTRAPPPFALLMLGVLAATLALAFSALGTKLVARAPIAWLIGYQVFRAPLEYWLHAMYENGSLPVQITWSGRNFDVITGALALPVAVLAARAAPPRRLIAVWNALGFALLVNVVVTALLSLPTPLRVFRNEPSTALVSTLPFIWLPAFLVQAALFGHVLVWRWLAHARRSAS
ncbi:MAG TPA: hypothetical protein VFT98_01610 [Myxococcota bacterium]|nr:hypothetical protein [Myxococcota bacterium]